VGQVLCCPSSPSVYSCSLRLTFEARGIGSRRRCGCFQRDEVVAGMAKGEMEKSGIGVSETQGKRKRRDVPPGVSFLCRFLKFSTGCEREGPTSLMRGEGNRARLSFIVECELKK
jgi:hypothetical protein